MSATITHMRREIEEIPDAAARLLDGSAAVLAEAGRGIREHDPHFRRHRRARLVRSCRHPS